jgi:hypothetical protein
MPKNVNPTMNLYYLAFFAGNALSTGNNKNPLSPKMCYLFGTHEPKPTHPHMAER